MLVIAIDFNTEMAKEKDEISYLLSTLEDSSNCIEIDFISFFDFKPPFQSIVFISNHYYSSENTSGIHHERGPPLL
ncbi:MAG: hypothetical protein HGGPFJEG_02545 [Ignavibacteria bacterium]|nr:hypothetical protein [Ignavibacteria bacterium]